MKQFLVAFVVFGFCLFLSAGALVQEPEEALAANPRFFFNIGNSDPCTNRIYQLLNITDAKCSLQCYIQAGLQQGGYCDENSVCQCNQIA